MAYVKLHDIPIETFIKYFMNNSIDTDTIGSNARYQPEYELFTTNMYYQYKYNLNSESCCVKMPVQPELSPTMNVLKLLYNVDQENNIHKQNGISTVWNDIYQVSLDIPKIKDNVLAVLSGITNEDELADVLETGYDAENATLFDNSTIYDDDENGKVFASSGNSFPVYYLGLKNPIAKYMNNLSMYPYFAEIKGRYYYSVTKVDEDFYYITDETSASDPKKLIEWFDNKINIIANEVFTDPSTNLQYYSVVNHDNHDIECGRVYILPEYKTIVYGTGNNAGKVKYRDTYTNEFVYFIPSEMPLSPIMKYHNYMRALKDNAYVSSEIEINDATRFPTTNNLYYGSYPDRDEIAVAFQYTKEITTPASYGMISSSTVLDNFISTLHPKTVSSNQEITYNNDILDELNDLIGWKSKEKSLNIISSSVFTDNGFVDTEKKVNNVHTTTTTKLYPNEVKNFNENIIYKNNGGVNNFAITDSINSRIKTIFSTNKVYVIRKFEKYTSGVDTKEMPYKSQGITLSDNKFAYSLKSLFNGKWFVVNSDLSAMNSIQILNKKCYEKLKMIRTRTQFLAFDTITEINQSTKEPTSYTDQQIIQSSKCGIYYFELEAVTENENDAHVGNETNYILKIQPLNKYIARIIASYLSPRVLTYRYIKNNACYTYKLNASLQSSPAMSMINRLNQVTVFPSLQRVKEIFKSYSLIVTGQTSIAAPLKFGANTQTAKESATFNKILPSTVENDRSNVYALSQKTDKFTMYQYTTSLFKNLLYTVTPEFLPNTGGICYNRYSHNTYIGFINYDDTNIGYKFDKTYLTDLYNAEQTKVNTAAPYSLNDDELDAIDAEVKSQNFIRRLLNYKTYVINAEEILQKQRDKSYEKSHKNIITRERVNKNILNGVKTTYKTYTQQIFDISDLVTKSFDLYTEYLFADNRKYHVDTMGHTTNIREIDYYKELTENDIKNAYSEGNLQQILDKQSFYRKDINKYIYKLLQDTNDFIYDNHNTYNLRFTFQHNANDKKLFYSVLSKMSAVADDRNDLVEYVPEEGEGI